MAVQFDITETGGQLRDVQFRLGRRVVRPFSTAPWCDKPEAAGLVPVLRELRGDFFCLPFGAGPGPNGEEYPPHGEAANAVWTVTNRERGRIRAALHTRMPKGLVVKKVETRHGETNIYQTHELRGFRGRLCFGHHAMLDFKVNGSGLVSCSRLRLAQVLPAPFEDPARGGYSCLRQGAWFRRLDSVPMAAGGTADLSRYPAREGYEDLVMIHHKDTDDFAWTAVVFPERQFVWFSLKNPAVLASTVLWHSNGGRHYPPWNGRHRGVLGVEDVTAYFHLGLGASARSNAWNERGVPTTIEFQPHRFVRVPYIIGVAAVPPDFGEVRVIRRVPGGAQILSASGRAVFHTVDTDFLRHSRPDGDGTGEDFTF